MWSATSPEGKLRRHLGGAALHNPALRIIHFCPTLSNNPSLPLLKQLAAVRPGLLRRYWLFLKLHDVTIFLPLSKKQLIIACLYFCLRQILTQPNEFGPRIHSPRKACLSIYSVKILILDPRSTYRLLVVRADRIWMLAHCTPNSTMRLQNVLPS